jgi:hypothetical protein
VAAVGLSALILGALFFQILFPPAPINGIALTVRGNRTVGYTASFYLLDSNGKIVSTDGRVTFEIMDIGFNVLYKIVFSVSHNDFDVTNQSARFSPGIGFPNIPTSTGPGYLWKIPSSQVSPARVMSSDPNDGRAQIYFVTPTGQNLTLFQTGGLQV